MGFQKSAQRSEQAQSSVERRLDSCLSEGGRPYALARRTSPGASLGPKGRKVEFDPLKLTVADRVGQLPSAAHGDPPESDGPSLRNSIVPAQRVRRFWCQRRTNSDPLTPGGF